MEKRNDLVFHSTADVGKTEGAGPAFDFVHRALTGRLPKAGPTARRYHEMEVFWPAASSGGIHVSYAGAQNALVINGGLRDTSVGYSANIRFGPGVSSSIESSHMTIAELGLMRGAADPMMLFPAGTTFTPYSILHNVSDDRVVVKPTLWWMEAGSADSAPLPPLTLAAGESRSLNLVSLIAATPLSNFNGSFNIEFDVQGKRGGLLLAAGSVDQSNTYVFEVTPRGIEETGSKSLGYWSTGNGDDTRCNFQSQIRQFRRRRCGYDPERRSSRSDTDAKAGIRPRSGCSSESDDRSRSNQARRQR